MAFGGYAAELANITIDQVPQLNEQLMSLISVEVAADDPNSLKISYNGNQALSIPLYTIPLKDIDNCTLLYNAEIRAESVSSKAYIEMLCLFEGGKEYFSRALDNALTGTGDWRSVKTPFFLKEGEQPSAARLGIRMEGPGTVWIRNLQLLQMETGLFTVSGNWQWLPGTLLGVFGGLFGGLAGSLASRGRGKGFIQAMGLFMIACSIILLATGFILLMVGALWSSWYAFLLPGVIGTMVMIPIYRNLLCQLQQAELRRMKAMDVMDGDIR
ncbi:MAG: hypothetical protein C4527_02775 [Candidatus Omnitrophota bacterium]|jgi:uncharacterized membrane protein YeaQ/YmgE (transglycosylase-associated protein family)|nr:MAG: hypothetical protein C4527_02775 [Candidatus Omnitrophota bacterium]